MGGSLSRTIADWRTRLRRRSGGGLGLATTWSSYSIGMGVRLRQSRSFPVSLRRPQIRSPAGRAPQATNSFAGSWPAPHGSDTEETIAILS